MCIIRFNFHGESSPHDLTLRMNQSPPSFPGSSPYIETVHREPRQLSSFTSPGTSLVVPTSPVLEGPPPGPLGRPRAPPSAPSSPPVGGLLPIPSSSYRRSPDALPTTSSAPWTRLLKEALLFQPPDYQLLCILCEYIDYKETVFNYST